MQPRAKPINELKLVRGGITIYAENSESGRLRAVRQLRFHTGLSWRAWADRCDRPFHFASVWRCANGKQVISLDTLAMLARAAGYSFECRIEVA